MNTELERNQHQWNLLGEEDPLWAILSDPSKRGRGWDTREFFATGQREIAGLMSTLARVAPVEQRRLAVDFGCGVGRLSRALASHFAKVVGVDIAESMIRGAREFNREFPACEFVHNAAPDLRFLPDASVDLLYSNITLQHVPSSLVPGYVREFIRVLAPGGTACFQLPAGPDRSLRGWVYRLAPDPVLNLLWRWKNRTRGVMEMHGTPQPRVREIVDGAGGHIVHIDPWPDVFRGWEAFVYYGRRR